jgi:hypothetical protein
MSLLAVALAVWAASERGERLALARRLDETRSGPTPAPALAPVDSVAIAANLPVPAASYLAGRLALEHGIDAWATEAGAPTRSGPPSPPPPILMVWQTNRLLDSCN